MEAGQGLVCNWKSNGGKSPGPENALNPFVQQRQTNSRTFRWKRKSDFTVGERTYIVMQRSLDSLVSRRDSGGELEDVHLCEMEVAGILSQVVHGVQFFHDMKFVHGDLKEESLVVCHAYEEDMLYTSPFEASVIPFEQPPVHILRVKISEAGFCRPAKAQNSTGTVGNWRYTAPELGRDEATYLFDIFSLGMIMYNLLQYNNSRDRTQTIDPVALQKLGEKRTNRARLLVKQMTESDPLDRIGIKEVVANLWFSGEDNDVPEADLSELQRRFGAAVRLRISYLTAETTPLIRKEAWAHYLTSLKTCLPLANKACANVFVADYDHEEADISLAHGEEGDGEQEESSLKDPSDSKRRKV